MNESHAWLAPLLQVGDSAFPTGGYAHSHGFEQIVQMGLVTDAQSMALHIENHLWPALIHFELPIVRLAREAALRGEIDELIALDGLVDASKSARELREASRVIGNRRLHALLDLGASPVMVRFARVVEEKGSPGHHAVVFGGGLAALPPDALLIAWAFQAINSICLAAPKLIRIGQDAVQRVLAASLSSTAEKISLSQTIASDDLGWFDPSLEIASMHHEIAHERLFIS